MQNNLRYLQPQNKPSSLPPVRLAGPLSIGDIFAARQVLDKINNRQNLLKALNDFWFSALPVAFTEHCKIAGLKDKVLLIAVDSPSYAYELFLRTHELMKLMHQLHFPIKKFKFVFPDELRNE